MSTDWDVWCVDCDEQLTRFDNGRVKVMSDIIGDRLAIEAVGRAKKEAAFVDVECGYWGANHFNPGDWAKHAGHALKPRSEYGVWSDQCSHHVTCAGPNCGHSHPCVLNDGHEGPHA